MPAPKDIDPHENPFGHELRRLREQAGLTQAQLSEKLGYSDKHISKVENGVEAPGTDFIRDCDTFFDTNGTLVTLAGLVRKWVGLPSWFRWWAEHVEPFAHTLRNWEPLMVSGLLQTEDYARELIKSHPGLTEEQVERSVTARLERKKILDRDEPPVLWFLVAESALRYEVGDAKVMCGQLHYLTEMMHHTHVNIRVLPASAGAHPGLNGAFVIGSINGSPDVVYLENARAGQVIDRREDVQDMANIWQAISMEALPARASLDLIAKVMEVWT